MLNTSEKCEIVLLATQDVICLKRNAIQALTNRESGKTESQFLL